MAGPSRKRPLSITLQARARRRGASQVQAYFRARPAQPGEAIGNRYQIEAEIGQGGFAHVYRARQVALGHRAVALKLIVPQRLEERGGGEDADFFLKLFEKEALATSRLRHQNIVMVFDYGIWEKPLLGRLPYLVMEMLEGRSLEQRLCDGPIPPEESSELLRQILQALHHAHSRRILHLDLKPSNLFLDKSGLLKILDFGLARLDATRGHDGEASELWRQVLPYAATHCYLPPEQRDRSYRDVGSDLYAVGCILVDMLIGRQPGTAKTAEHGPLALPIETLPDLMQQLVVRALHIDRAKRFASAEEFLLATEAAQAQLRGHAVGQLEPYQSLAPFDRQHSALFFGRQRNIAALRARVDANQFTILIGTSGAGKTSLLRAGLLPLLEGNAWQTLLIEPGARPLTSLIERLELSGCASLEESRLLQNPALAAEALYALAERSGKRALLVVDQLEECFTQCPSKVERGAFLSALVAIADDTKGVLRLLIAVREDFLSRLAEHRALIEKTDDNLILLRPPDADDLRAALCAPAALHSFTFEPGLADVVLQQLESDRHAAPLPILQLVATKLWEGRDEAARLLRQATLAQVGGVAGVLAAHAETALGELRSTGERRIVPELFCALVTPEGTRRALVREHILAMFPADRVDAEAVLERLIAGRLLLSRVRDGEEVIELVHEALISRWATLRSWLNEDPVVRKLRQQLVSDALAWQVQGKSAELLWKGERLVLARQCGESLSYGAVTDEFLLRSHQASRRRRFILLLAVLTSLAMLLAFVARERNHAAEAARDSQSLKELLDSQKQTQAKLLKTVREKEDGYAVQLRLTQEKAREVQDKDAAIKRSLEDQNALKTANKALKKTNVDLAAQRDDTTRKERQLLQSQSALQREGAARQTALQLCQNSSPDTMLAIQSLEDGKPSEALGKAVELMRARRENSLDIEEPELRALLLRTAMETRNHRSKLVPAAAWKLSVENIRDARFGEDNVLWAASAAGLFRVDLASQVVHCIDPQPVDRLALSSHYMLRVGRQVWLTPLHALEVPQLPWQDGRVLAEALCEDQDGTPHVATAAGKKLWIGSASPRMHTLLRESSALAWRPDCKELALGDPDGGVWRWNVSQDIKPSHPTALSDGSPANVTALRYLPSGSSLLALPLTGVLTRIEHDQRSQLAPVRTGKNHEELRSLDIDAAGNLAVVAGSNKEARLFLLTQSHPFSFRDDAEQPLRLARLSPDGKLLLLVSQDSSARLYRLDSASLLELGQRLLQ